MGCDIARDFARAVVLTAGERASVWRREFGHRPPAWHRQARLRPPRRWLRWFRRLYNLPHPERCTHAVIVEVEALARYGAGGRLYRRPIDRAAAWSGEYQGPGRIVERPMDWESPLGARFRRWRRGDR